MGPPCQPGLEDPQNAMCPVTDWSGWSPCSTTCGKGLSTRTRFLLADPSVAPKCQHIELSQQKECSEKPDCSFDMSTAKGMFYYFLLFRLYEAPSTNKLIFTRINIFLCFTEVCMLEDEYGQCNGQFSRWYYEPKKQMCVPFIYSGCRGNRNNFETQELCMEACGALRGKLLDKTNSSL